MTSLAALLDGPLDARTLLAHLGYLASVVMFMLALIRMSRVKTAGGANTLAAGAMALAVVSQLVELGSFDPTWLAAGFLVGGLVGGILAARVSMTGMPELVALLNGFGGFASTLVGIGTWFHWTEHRAAMGAGPLADAFTGVNLMLTIVLGNLTFTGSLVAYLKLSERMPTRPLLLPARNAINLVLFVASLALSVAAAIAFTNGSDAASVVWLVTGVTLLLGATLVLPIGGGDMPVVISLHDSFAGFAGALAGFAIGSPVLIVAGTIVGAAGMILTRIMCKSMNRGMWNVVLGGFGAVAEQAASGGGYGTVRSADAEEAAMVLADARTCIIVPGYGMAVAQAQHAVRELGDLLEKRGCTVRYAVHPVAGRMPGHMNVLLAEANVPYDKLFEMDAIDSDFKNTDVAIVIGANDVVNPAAKTNPQSPLYGMPVLSVDEAKTVFVIKRSLGAGFAGVKNELFERENTRMIYADAKKALEDIAKALKDA